MGVSEKPLKFFHSARGSNPGPLGSEPSALPLHHRVPRRVTALIPQTTALWLYFPAYLKLLNRSLTGRFKSTFPLLTFYLIASMGSVRDVLLAIFFLFLLILGHSLLAVSVKLSQLRWTYRKLSIESDTSLYFLNCPLSVTIPLSVPLSPVSFLGVLSQP